MTPSASGDASAIFSHRHRVVVTLRLNVRRRLHQKTGHYLSPSMQSLVYSITGPSPATAVVGSGAVNLTTASSYCSQHGAMPLVCTTQIPLTLSSSGSYTFDVATYDAPQSCGPSGVCSVAPCVPAHSTGANCLGNVLSDQTIPETLTIGQANAVTLSLGADTASVTVTPLNPGLLRGDDTGLTLWGNAAQKVAIVARDADGNAIAGPASPAIALGVDATTLTATPAKLTGSGVVALQWVGASSQAYTTLSMNVTAPATGGGVPATNPVVVPVWIRHGVVLSGECQFDDTGTPSAVTWISNTVGCSSNADVSGAAAYPQYGGTTLGLEMFGSFTANNAVFEVPGDVGFNPVTIAGLNAPTGIAASQKTSLLYIINSGTGSIVVTQADGTNNTTISGGSTGLNSPTGVALDENENLYVTNNGNNSVTVYAAGQTSGNVAPTATISGAATGLNNPQGVAIGLGGTIWVANQGANSVTEYAAGANGNAAPIATLTGLSSPDGVAIDAAGTIFVANASTKTVTEYPAGSSGSATPSATLVVPGSAPSVAVVPAAEQP